MLVKTFAGAVHGVDAQLITIEVNTGGAIGPGSNTPGYFIVGLPDNAVREGLQRMEAALKNKGLINRETIGFFIAGLIELCVLFTAFLAVRSGQSPFPFQPTRMLTDLQTRAEQQDSWLIRTVTLLTLAAVIVLLLLLLVLAVAAGFDTLA